MRFCMHTYIKYKSRGAKPKALLFKSARQATEHVIAWLFPLTRRQTRREGRCRRDGGLKDTTLFRGSISTGIVAIPVFRYCYEVTIYIIHKFTEL